MTRFGLLAAALVDRLEREAASKEQSPSRDQARATTALAGGGEKAGCQFQRKERV